MKRCITLLCLAFCNAQNIIPTKQLPTSASDFAQTMTGRQGFQLRQDSVGQVGGHSKRELYSYVLKMRLPHHLEFHTPVPGFYKGNMFELGNHCSLISEDSQVLTFSLIITPEVTFESQGNNVHFQRRLPDQPFLWYDLTLHTRIQTSEDEDKKAYTWSVKKLSPQEAPLQIPDHAIIIYYDPELIEKLEDLNKSDSCGKDSSHVITLPTIIVQSEADQEQFDKICDEAWLAALELRTIHQKESVETHQATPQTIINVCK